MQLVPATMKPSIVIPKSWIQLSILGVILFSAAPLFRLVDVFFTNQSLLTAFISIVGKFEIGRAWALTASIAFFFLLFVTFFPVLENRTFTKASFVFLLPLILLVGWTSHSASIADWRGFLFHILHFLAVITWVGLLFVVSWFSTDSRNWLRFLDWFTYVAVICVMIIVGSGIFLMQFVLDPRDYVDAWIIPYGQAILIKHLLILPVLIFAFINGVWIKRLINEKKRVDPLPWVRSESIVLLLVFTATGVLGQQEPPIHIDQILQRNGFSPLFQFFHGESFRSFTNVGIHIGPVSILLFVLAALFACMVLYAFKMRAASFVSFVMSLLCALCIYLGLMTSIT